MMMISFILLITITISQQQVYDGPATLDYFQTSFNQSIDDLPEITCSNITQSFYSNYTTNTYFGETTESNPVQYYKLSITAEMKLKYSGELYLSTCCDQEWCDSYIQAIVSWTSNYTADDFVAEKELCNEQEIEDGYYLSEGKRWNYSQGNITDRFCIQNRSLDTLIYIFQEKRDRISYFDVNDDSECSNAKKSRIDLSEYLEGDYIIGIGGYAKDYGSYYLQLQCIQYSFPITDEQLDPPTDLTNFSSITCGTSIPGKINQTNPVDYYLLNITKSTYLHLPANITTSNWYAILYLFKEVTNNQYEIIDSDLYYGDLTLLDYDVGVYWILVQGYLGWEANYTLTMECTIIPPKIPRDLMMALVFGIAGCLLLLIIVYYIYEWVRYLKNKPDNALSPRSADSYEQVGQNEKAINIMELAGTRQQLSVVPAEASDDEEPEITGFVEQRSIADFRKPSISVAGVNIRRLDSDRHLGEQMQRNEDVVQTVLSHAISCCKDKEKLDMFQVLAIRYYEKNSREVRGFTPFSAIGINIEIIHFSPFFRASFVSFIVGLTQTWGISVVVIKLVSAYFEGENYALACDMSLSRWQEIFSLKILAFLLSLIVTFFISVLLKGIKHNGLYKMMHELHLKHIKLVHNNIAIWIVQLGQAINYFVCLVAILGSYFIIFSSNQGEEQDDGSLDYSSAGLDMILNALALFFMLELDDLLVTDDDYDDCGEHLEWILKNYKPNMRINEVYKPKSEEVVDVKESEDDESGSGSFIVSTMNKCSSCMTTVMYRLINFFSVFVTICCYGGGFAAPFVIFFCW